MPQGCKKEKGYFSPDLVHAKEKLHLQQVPQSSELAWTLVEFGTVVCSSDEVVVERGWFE